MKRLLLVMFVVCASISRSLLAQEVSDTLQYNGSLTLGGSYKTGLVNQTSIRGSVENSFKKSDWALYNRTSYFYSEVNNNRLFNDWTVVSKLGYTITDRAKISPTLFHLYKSNLLFRILNSHRFLFGASITPLKNPKALVYVGVGFDNTSYAGDQFVNSDLNNSNRRFGISTIHVENKHHFGDKKFSLSYSLFYFQSFKESADYTVWLIPAFAVAFNKKLSLVINYDFRYRNVHLVDFPAINQALTVNLNVSFQS
ncbi:MAG: DUF481 domain-containing protein [Bacteroidia bacterium]|nr:DUF481 domain-containing protein [Bacteroidia bacterium]